MLRFRLLASAFTPMLLIVAVRVAQDHRLLAMVMGLVSLAVIFSLMLLLTARGATNAQPYKLAYVKDESAQVPAYLLTYVFPFVFVEAHSAYDLIAYTAFVVLLAVMLLRTDLILVNPLLLALGFHLFQIEATSGFKGLLLARERPMAGQEIEAVHWAAGALKLTEIKE